MTAQDRTATPHGEHPTRHIVQHECGHAAAFVALGYPFGRISMIGPAGPAVYPVEGGASMLGGHQWTIMACGAIADQQARGLRMRGSQIVQLVLGGNGDKFEIDDAATGQVAVRPFRAPAVQPGGDLEQLSKAFAEMQMPEARQGLIRFWRWCEEFAAALRPAIDALTEAVLERGEVAYAEAREIAAVAMAGQPMPRWSDEWAR